MDYIPSSDADLDRMLRDVGIPSFEALLKNVPSSLRHPRVRLPPALSEMELQAELGRMARENTPVDETLSFLGAGAYEHFIPSVVDAIASRGEFATAYTPYQAEASQGTLQVVYEYQSMICALTGMDVSNASLYDGSSAVAEAALLARAIQRDRRKILVASTLHPDYRLNLLTYLRGADAEVVEIPQAADGGLDLAALKRLADASTVAVFAQNPNYHGVVEPMREIADIAHAAGALLVAAANPISLGLLQPPGEYGADLAVGEAQPLGIPLGYGGPWLGYLACNAALVHKISGRIVGCTVDEEGQPGFCLTLQAREQHIRREKATSNICTNQSLMALRACVYLSAVGRKGIQEVARLNYLKAHALADELAKAGLRRVHSRPFFNEFVVETPVPAVDFCREALEHGLIAGCPLEGQANRLLVCVTETKSREQLQRYVEVVRAISKPGARKGKAAAV